MFLFLTVVAWIILADMAKPPSWFVDIRMTVVDAYEANQSQFVAGFVVGVLLGSGGTGSAANGRRGSSSA